jgi:hypothetical protein
MRYLGIAGLLLTAALASSAIVTSSASAADGVFCVKVAVAGQGNFSNATCTGAQEAGKEFVRAMVREVDKVGTEEYCAEVLPGQRKFAKGYLTLTKCKNKEVLEEEGGTESGLPLWTQVKDPAAGDRGGTAKTEFKVLPTVKTIAGSYSSYTLGSAEGTVKCTKGTNGGEITSMDAIGKVKIDFSGCGITNAKGTCTIKTAGASGGLILTNALRGLLGSVKGTEAFTEVGLLFEPETGKLVATLAATPAPCETPETAVEGSVAGEVEPVGVKVSATQIAFELGSSKQAIKSITVLSGSVKPKLLLGATEATVEAISELAVEGEFEIM